MDRGQQLEARLQSLTRTIKLSDFDHDRHVRALYYGFTAQAESADTPAERERILTMRDQVLPDGLNMTRRTYADQHGAVVEAEQRVTPEVLAFMQQSPTGATTLHAIFLRWLASGKALGQLIKERARLVASARQNAEGQTQLNDTRLDWLRVVRVFLSALSLLALAPEHVRAILAPLKADIANALARRASGQDEDLPGEDLPGEDEDLDLGDEPLPEDEGDDPGDGELAEDAV